jgi:UPF0716 protein FxsA
MSLGKLLGFAVLVLPLAEIVAFYAVAQAIGFLAAVALTILTSLAGLALLRRTGRPEVVHLRRAGAGGVVTEVEARGGEFWTALAGILLTLPGFLTDIMGALLLVPYVQRRLLAAVRRAAEKAMHGGRRGDGVIDLPPEDWHQVPEQRIGQDRPPDSPPDRPRGETP